MHDDRKFRILTIIDEGSRECLDLIGARQLKHEDFLVALAELFIARVPPANIRSDNGSEFIATAVQKWQANAGAQTSGKNALSISAAHSVEASHKTRTILQSRWIDHCLVRLWIDLAGKQHRSWLQNSSMRHDADRAEPEFTHPIAECSNLFQPLGTRPHCRLTALPVPGQAAQRPAMRRPMH